MTADHLQARFVDRSGQTDPAVPFWPAVVVTKAEIDEQIDRLASISRPANGRRRALIVHPHSDEPGLGFTPGIRVSLEVLLPGERTDPIRQDGALVGFCIGGDGGDVIAAGEKLAFDRYDIWTVPSMAVHTFENRTDVVQTRLMYCTSPLLEKLRVPFVQTDPPEQVHPDAGEPSPRDVRVDELVELESPDALIRSYEALVAPEVVAHRPTIWRWREAKRYLDPQEVMGQDYQGRMVSMLSSRLTGRTMGTTNTLTAFLSVLPANLAHKPHRHSATAINYHFAGRGHSVIGGQKFSWQSGDLLFGAPGLAVHHHASGDEKVYAMTVQDNALHLAMNTDLWQEDLKGQPILVGAEQGFATNRAELAAQLAATQA